MIYQLSYVAHAGHVHMERQTADIPMHPLFLGLTVLAAIGLIAGVYVYASRRSA